MAGNDASKEKKLKIIKITEKDLDIKKLDINPERENIIVIEQRVMDISK
jgi:hypothetical protein